MTDRKWLPKDYQDEVIPPPRNSPNDWIVRLPGDAYGLAPADEEYGDPHVLKDGDIVEFDWTVYHGQASFFVADDADRNWWIDVDEPKVPEGGYMIVAEHCNAIDTMQDGLSDFAKAFIENLTNADLPCETTIIFYSWSLKSVKFRFQNGQFHSIDAPPHGAAS